MTAEFREVMALIGLALDGLGVLIVAVGAVVAMLHALLQRLHTVSDRYRVLREDLGRAILVGLEVLIAGDIIRSVVVDPTLVNVGVLGLIVLIWTFLSMTLQLEVEGRWPWQRGADSARPGQAAVSPPRDERSPPH
jgi:uncharacterized membrane protein